MTFSDQIAHPDAREEESMLGDTILTPRIAHMLRSSKLDKKSLHNRSLLSNAFIKSLPGFSFHEARALWADFAASVYVEGTLDPWTSSVPFSDLNAFLHSLISTFSIAVAF